MCKSHREATPQFAALGVGPYSRNGRLARLAADLPVSCGNAALNATSNVSAGGLVDAAPTRELYRLLSAPVLRSSYGR